MNVSRYPGLVFPGTMLESGVHLRLKLALRSFIKVALMGWTSNKTKHGGKCKVNVPMVVHRRKIFYTLDKHLTVGYLFLDFMRDLYLNVFLCYCWLLLYKQITICTYVVYY